MESPAMMDIIRKGDEEIKSGGDSLYCLLFSLFVLPVGPYLFL